MTDGGERSRKSYALESPLEIFQSQNSENITNSTTYFKELIIFIQVNLQEKIIR